MPAVPAPLPGLPAAAWRPLTLDDIPAYVRLMEAARVADGESEVSTEETARHDLADPMLPLATNSLVLAEPDGTLRGCVLISERPPGETTRRLHVEERTDPSVRDLGVGDALLDWTDARAYELLAGQPADLERYVDTFMAVSRREAFERFERHGYRPVRWFMEMRRDLGQPVPTEPDLDGIRLAIVADDDDPELRERLRVAHNEAFADHWGTEPIPPETWDHVFVGHPFFRADLSLIAFDGDQIAGYSSNYVAEPEWEATGVREGWIGQLGVRRQWRRRGLATALLVRSMNVFSAAGLEAATLGVDTENPTGAVGIYERVGFREIRRAVRLRKPFEALAQPK